MKTNYLLIVLCALISLESFAQNEWAPLGTEWHFGLSYGVNDAFPGSNFYYHFKIEKDTVVLGQDCRIMKRTVYNDDGGVSTLNYYTYSENDSVYLYRPDREIDFRLVFDFTAEEDDILTFYTYNATSPTLYDTSTYSVLEVSDFDLGGTPIKKWRTQLLSTTGYLGYDIPTTYYESVGNFYGFDLSFGFVVGPPISWQLRCFSDGQIDYNAGITCDTILLSNNEVFDEPAFPVQVFPNPVDLKHPYLSIELPDFPLKEKGELKLFNAAGQAVQTLAAPLTNHKYEMEVSTLNSGLYLLSWIVDGRIINTQKIVLH